MLGWILAFLSLTSVKSSFSPLKALLQEPPEVKNQTYAGSWTTQSSGLFGTFSSLQGRSRWTCINFYPKWVNRFDCQLTLFDGEWEDAEVYAIRMFENWFDYETRSIVVNSTALLLNWSDYEGRIAVNGRLGTSPNLTIRGNLAIPGFRIALNLEAIDIKSPKIAYTLIVSVLTAVQLWAFLALTRDCTASEPTALSVSLGFTFITCIIDCWIWLWHVYLSLRFPYAFNYLIINAFWSFLVIVANVGRLLPIVWKAHYRRNRLNSVDFEPTLGDFHSFEGKFVGLAVLMAAICMAFREVFSIFTVLAYCFYVPQLISNAILYRRNRVHWQITASHGFSRLLFAVNANQIYWFGYSGNLLVWEPRHWLCCLLSALITLQTLLLHWQSSRLRTWLFLPKSLRSRQYDYFSPPSSLTIAQTECAICMTSLRGSEGEPASTAQLMYAPCGHIFHADCLVNWMRIKLECPSCRGQLPALEEEEDR
jgi:hypothetical protein